MHQTKTTTSKHVHGPTRWALAALAVGALLAPAVASAVTENQTLSGTGISRLPDDTRRLTVTAESTSGGATDGRVTFAHDNDPNGISRFKGTVSCLRVTGSVAEISGTVTKGETAAGVVLTGRQFAVTITLGQRQAFSLPRFAATIDPCSGGRPETVAVDHGRFMTR